MKAKKLFFWSLHIFFLSGLFYAFGHFLKTPRSSMLARRLWAYESWIILSFYALFVYLTLKEEEIRLKKPESLLAWFKTVLSVNLLLLIFPWGIFLLVAPQELLQMFELTSRYWRILGLGSLIGALIYYVPHQFYKKKISYYILVFGAMDNFLAGFILSLLFALHKVPLIAWSVSPLLFYFSYLFFRQGKEYKKSFSNRINQPIRVN
ncbi:MAG: hypothetical protein U9M98_03810 [Patescibacteria group bacterium]|nr:hypothetical protein [Patescibacteria group bacterium]